jgi:hypothetical protein
MSSPRNNSNLGPPPAHPMPRRASPENSITLRNHRLAREASLRPNVSQHSPSTEAPTFRPTPTAGDSDDANAADWFDNENQNTRHGAQSMDVDPPFYLKASDSSSTDLPLLAGGFLGPPHATTTTGQSSSADDYRSIVDDLTIQIQRLREENKRLRSRGPDVMKDEQLFEVRCHDLLSRRKKRELEATLREFAANLKETQSNRNSAGSSQRKKSSASSRNHQKAMYSSGSGSMSKHASSTASQSRPVDSAYASGSGPYSSGTSLTRPSLGSAQSSGRKVENYLREIPEGLYQGPTVLSDKDKKKTVVRRLEQIFTGKITGRSLGRTVTAAPAGVSAANLPPPNLLASSSLSSSMDRPQTMPQVDLHPLKHTQPPAPLPAPAPPPPAPPLTSFAPAPHTSTSAPNLEPHREAQMLPRSGKKGRSRDNLSMSNSNSNGDESGKTTTQTRPSANPTAGAQTNSLIASPLEQRPTRPLDLDPDRAQVPSENMEYLRHLGLVPPELLQGSMASCEDVPADADGWVYLNLLCNMAQLHIFSVTPDFIRNAVSEKSTKFQLSPDGNKIRWRGGCEGTRFSSDSSGGASQKSPMTDETEGSEGGDRHHSKRQRIGPKDDHPSAPSSKHAGRQSSGANNNAPSQRTPSTHFHYKPLFVRRGSSQETSTDGSSSYDAGESFNPGSQWGRSGSGSNQRRGKKRRANGAVIYYSGAPFCTDLSRDPGEFSSDTYMQSDEHGGSETVSVPGPVSEPPRPPIQRTTSGSSLPFRPLSDGLDAFRANDDAGSIDSDDVKEIDMTMLWSDGDMQDGKEDVVASLAVPPMQASGTFGIEPQDHFKVVVETRRPRQGAQGVGSDAMLSHVGDAIISRLESMTTASPVAAGASGRLHRSSGCPVSVEYVSRRLEVLAPSEVPPPLSFVPFTDTSSSYNSALAFSADISEEAGSASELMSRRANPHHSDDPDSPNGASSGAVADGELDDNDDLMAGDERVSDERRSKGSSVATAGGGIASGYSSGAADSPL